MAHQAQLANEKYRNWVRAGLGIKYVKEGLEPFCDNLANQQHIDLLKKVKQTHNLSAVSCGQCNVRTLQPNHVRTRNKQCPLGQIHCNCQHPGGKTVCPNNVCGAIYDEIIQLHASTPPAPFWRNTDARQWCTEPWSVAKCFINAPGYENKTQAREFDCLGLLHVLINNKGFQQHMKCTISGTDVFSKVHKSRNAIFHSHTMELEDTEVNRYIDDMIELLEDEKEIKHRQESKDAVKNLLELKRDDFVISTTDEVEIRRVALATINEKEKELKQTIADAENELETKTDEGKQAVEGKGLVIKSELEETGRNIRKELLKKEDEIRTTVSEGKHDIEGKGFVIKSELEETRQNIRKELLMKEDEIRTTAIEGKHDIEGKVSVIKSELEETGQNIERELMVREDESKKKLEQKGMEIEKQLRKEREDAEVKLEQKLQESKLQLERKKNAIEDIAETKREPEKSKQKADFQKKLVKVYKKYVSRTSTLPLKPEKTQMDVDVSYVPPLMTVDIKDETSKEWKEAQISIQDIFENEEIPAKAIYVIGEAGSGKSMFCKILVHFWCIAHSYPECSLDESDIVKEMASFNFLFFVSLRHVGLDSIENMLKKLYDDPALGDILQNESDKCLIILDGLDEWTPERIQYSQFLTPGLPGRELDADYTIITTSRQWKFDSLRIKDSEIDKKIKLKGIDQHEIEDLTEKTVIKLNDLFRKSKNPDDCKSVLERSQFSELIKIPLILQQLICLWFDDKLLESSKHAIYSNMLALFFEWKTLKTLEDQECEIVTQECMTDSPLPDYLSDFETFRENTCVIQYLSNLAYETLSDKNKENTLTFSNLMLKRLNIPNDVKKYCLNIGILKIEESVSLHASVRQQTSLSFFHKSMQEYLAAVYVASQFKQMLPRNVLYNLKDVCKKCEGTYFGSRKTIVDILEQSNVLIMLCGLEPRLLTNVSEYVYNAAIVDIMVVEERNKVLKLFNSDHHKLLRNIQICIFKCIEEVMPIAENGHPPVYIADLYVDSSMDLLRYGQNIMLKYVLSIEINGCWLIFINPDKGGDNESFHLIVKLLTKCDQLKIMRYDTSNYSDERITYEVITILKTNVRTLEKVRLFNIDEGNMTHLVSILPKMRQLTSLQVRTKEGDSISHDVCLSLCKYLIQTTSLPHVSLAFRCKKGYEYMIDLSKHKQLQHLDFQCRPLRLVSCNLDNLETCELSITSNSMMNQVCNALYNASKLKHLDLERVQYRLHYEIARSNTENLIKLLPSLVSLSTLELWNFSFTDNIIARPSDMKNLKEIILRGTMLSLTTWCKFIDSLPALPQAVKVISTFDTLFGYGEHKADEQQYVRDKMNSFRVTRDDIYWFEFTTKKV